MAIVLLPTPLRRLAGGQSKVTIDAADLGAVIQRLETDYPGIGDKVLDGSGEIKRFINVFVNENEVRTLQGLSTPVSEGDKISIVPAMAGGAA